MNLKGFKYPKSKATYEKTNELAEKICQIMHFLVVNVAVPAFVLPKAIFSFFMYYSNNFDNNAFELPFATW